MLAGCPIHSTYQKGCPEVLHEDDALELNNEEIDELLSVVQESLERLFGNDEVLLRSHLRGDAISQHSLACNLSCSSDTKDHVEGLECIANNIEVASGEDEENCCGEGNAGSTWVLPLWILSDVRTNWENRSTYAQQSVEHRVVVWLLVNIQDSFSRNSTYVSKAGQLLLGCLVFVSHLPDP